MCGVRSRHFVCVPVQFTPQVVGQFSARLIVQTDRDDVFTVALYGVCE